MIEEKELSRRAETQIFRVYGLTGRYINNPMTFAIGDFLLKATIGERILVKAKHPVVRSYVNASDIAKGAIRWLFSDDEAVGEMETSSHIITLVELAKKISVIYDLKEAKYELQHGESSSYSYSPIYFDKFLSRYGLKAMTLEEQIYDTAVGVTEWKNRVGTRDL